MHTDLKLTEFRNSLATPWTYSMLDAYQRTTRNEIIFSELAPVITLGKRAKAENFTNIPIIELDRGGLETWHGPGQMVVFPVLDMVTFFGSKLALKKAVNFLLEVTLETVKHFRPDAHAQYGDRLGIWTSEGKLVSIGISIRDGKLYHGVAINLYRTSESFKGINPCGIKDAEPSFCFESENENAFSLLRARWVQSCLARLSPQALRPELVSESLSSPHVSYRLEHPSTSV